MEQELFKRPDRKSERELSNPKIDKEVEVLTKMSPGRVYEV